MFYLTIHSTYFILWLYGVRHWYTTTQILREETYCCQIVVYYFQLASRDLLYAASLKEDSIYHDLY